MRSISAVTQRLPALRNISLPNLRHRQAHPIGIDIGRRRIRLASFVMDDGGLAVSRLLDGVLPPGMVTAEGIVDYEGIADELARLVESAGIRRGRAAVALSGGDVFLRRVPMPRTSRQEALRQVSANPNLRPNYLDLESNKIEIEILDPGDNNRPMQVLMAVAKREAIRARQRILLDAGLMVSAVDVDSCALFNIFRHCRPEVNQRCTLLHIGDEWSLITILDEKGPEVARRADIGIATLVDFIHAEGAGPSKPEIERLLFTHASPTSQFSSAFDTWANALVMEARQSAGLIRRGDTTTGDIYLSGGGAIIEGIAPLIAAKAGLPVQVFNPLKTLRRAADFIGRKESEGPAFTIALGLALRQIL